MELSWIQTPCAQKNPTLYYCFRVTSNNTPRPYTLKVSRSIQRHPKGKRVAYYGYYSSIWMNVYGGWMNSPPRGRAYFRSFVPSFLRSRKCTFWIESWARYSFIQRMDDWGRWTESVSRKWLAGELRGDSVRFGYWMNGIPFIHHLGPIERSPWVSLGVSKWPKGMFRLKIWWIIEFHPWWTIALEFGSIFGSINVA